MHLRCIYLLLFLAVGLDSFSINDSLLIKQLTQKGYAANIEGAALINVAAITYGGGAKVVNQYGVALVNNKFDAEARMAPMYAFKMIHGYKFAKHCFAGIGIEIDGDKHGINFAPVFADFRYRFGLKKLSGYFVQQIGYAFLSSNAYIDLYNTRKINGGAMAETKFGLTTLQLKHLAFNLFAGWRLQHIAVRKKPQYRHDEEAWHIINTNHYLYSCFIIGMGFTF